MIQPLTKCQRDGRPLTRPEPVERAIGVAVSLPRDELLRRARISDPADQDFLPPECLVHMIRGAIANGHGDLSNPLLFALLDRCAAMLRVSIRGNSQAAEDLRQATLDRLADKFAVGTPAALDFLEVRFQSVFRRLKIDSLRAQSDRGEPIEDDEGDTPRLVDAAPQETARAELGRELVNEVRRLPKKERFAVALHYLLGYEIESVDPNKRTVATACGVSGRTIRTLLKNAQSRLRKFAKEKE